MEYEVAPFSRRVGAFIIDFIAVYLLWYLFTQRDLEKVNVIIKTLDPMSEGLLDVFAEEMIKLYVAFILKLLFAQTLYYTLVPAVIGRGRTVGKLICGLSMLDSETLKEITPIKLVFREFVLRGLLETLLVVPFAVSIFMVCFRKKATAIHDLWAKTVVVKDSSFSGDEDE